MQVRGTLHGLFVRLRIAREEEKKEKIKERSVYKIIIAIFEALHMTGEQPESYGYTCDELLAIGRTSAAAQLYTMAENYRNDPNPPHELYMIYIRETLAYGQKLGFSDVDTAMCETQLAEIDRFVR